MTPSSASTESTDVCDPYIPMAPERAGLSLPQRTTSDRAELDRRILVMRKYARCPGLPTDSEHSRASSRRAKQPRGRGDRDRQYGGTGQAAAKVEAGPPALLRG
jgi:hypothetical protein